MTKALIVRSTGPLATVQDLGRHGLAAVGVGHSGAADPGALRLGNRLLGNPESLAGIEVTYGGLRVEARGDLLVAVTGAPCPVAVDGRQVAAYSVVRVPGGATLELGVPPAGLRSYLTVRGGIAVAEVLHSRSTDTLARLGPDVLTEGTRLPVGPPPGRHPLVDHAPVATLSTGDLRLRVVPGPRADWFTATALDRLLTDPYEVSSDSDRVGMRLTGPELDRARPDELPSEGMVCGALQVPPSGAPTLFLTDHPVTGGYPVIAVVVAADLGRAAQARPGQRLHFVPASTRGAHHAA
jgi:biotin-dependent carboxylase-like uncharacterized protein